MYFLNRPEGEENEWPLSGYENAANASGRWRRKGNKETVLLDDTIPEAQMQEALEKYWRETAWNR